MRIQLWSYNYDPEPSGIGPLSGVWTQAMRSRGHDVCVVAAHPHYPKAVWGKRLRPYRERRAGVPVIRLPLWIGRQTGAQRIRQELTYASCLSLVAPLLPPADVIVAVSPSFPALLPAMATATVRRTPWALWLQDILPDGAATTGLIEAGALLDAARRFERAAYASAARVVVISEAFERNLIAKGVARDKLALIYNPSPVPVGSLRGAVQRDGPCRLLVMGNIGHSQGLDAVVESLQRTNVLERTDCELRIAGHGVAAAQVSAATSSERIQMLGLLFGQAMEDELNQASVGLVTQRGDLHEFNLPSKLMNYVAHSLPVIAVVNPDSETARLVRETGSGWVVDSRAPDDLAPTLARALADPHELAERGRAAHAAASRLFAPERVAEKFEAVLTEMAA